MNTRYVAVLAVIVLAVVAGAFWFLQTPPPQPLPEIAPPAPLKTVAATPAHVSGSAPAMVRTTRPAVAQAAGKPATPPPLTDWEIKIEQVLTAKATETETAQMLINLLPTLPPEGQTEAAQHISNLIVDKDYNRILPLLRNASLPSEVQDVFVTDLMNREDPVKLPALLDVAKIPNHPYHEEALNDLQIFLDQDNGDNWSKWDTTLKAYLKKQAQEQAAAEAPEPAVAQ